MPNDDQSLLEVAQAVLDQARIVNGWADGEAHDRLLETGNQFRYEQTCLLTVRCDTLQMKLNSVAAQDDTDVLAEARAQGAAEERERLAMLADSAEWTELEVRQSSDNHFVTTLPEWLRSQKGEG